jgi:hypothetical protein
MSRGAARRVGGASSGAPPAVAAGPGRRLLGPTFRSRSIVSILCWSMRYSSTPEPMAPHRVHMGKPSRGVNPMVGSRRRCRASGRSARITRHGRDRDASRAGAGQRWLARSWDREPPGDVVLAAVSRHEHRDDGDPAVCMPPPEELEFLRVTGDPGANGPSSASARTGSPTGHSIECQRALRLAERCYCRTAAAQHALLPTHQGILRESE